MVSSLGQFLRATRGRVTPAEVGLPDGHRRRVPGLRREEVAQLAAVSVDYYVRLEQGRETAPSTHVVDAIGGALLLDEHERTHLYRLSGLTPIRSEQTGVTVDPDIQALLDEWGEHPAFVLGNAFDVIAANLLAEQVFLHFGRDRNLLLAMFLDPEHRQLYVEWRVIALNTVAGFRLLYAAQPDNPRICEVLMRLMEHSSEFRAMWAEQRAIGRRLVTKTIRHPRAGELVLRIQTFDLRSAPGQELVVYRADPSTDTRERLQTLVSGDRI